LSLSRDQYFSAISRSSRLAKYGIESLEDWSGAAVGDGVGGELALGEETLLELAYRCERMEVAVEEALLVVAGAVSKAGGAVTGGVGGELAIGEDTPIELPDCCDRMGVGAEEEHY